MLLHRSCRAGLLVLLVACQSPAGPGEVVLCTPGDVLAAVDALARPAVAVVRTDADKEVRFATLGPLGEPERRLVEQQLARDVLLETERIEHGRASPEGYRRRRARLLRALGHLTAGRYWVVGLDRAAWTTLSYPQFATAELDWHREELPPEAGQPRTLAIPFDLRVPAVQSAAAAELAAFATVLAALPHAERLQLLGEVVGKLDLPYAVPSAGFVTRIGTLPAGARLTADLLLELPR